MWTSEFQSDRIVVTVLDDQDLESDLQVQMLEGRVVFRQYLEIQDPDVPDDIFDEITITNQQFTELLEAMDKPEGTYLKRQKRK